MSSEGTLACANVFFGKANWASWKVNCQEIKLVNYNLEFFSSKLLVTEQKLATMSRKFIPEN